MSEPKNEPVKGLVILIVGFVIVWLICWGATVYFIEKWEDRSSFGEMFGSINTLFSGAALAGVIYAIFLQRRELQLQRHELELTREELKRSAEAQEKSEEALRGQIKEMQEQSELQLMPFVALVSDGAQIGLWNYGNGTAINIKVRNLEGGEEPTFMRDVHGDTSILSKFQHVTFSFALSTDHIDSEYSIYFENVNKKRYYVRQKLNEKGSDVIEFGPCKAS